jgi:hypothetical protein
MVIEMSGKDAVLMPPCYYCKHLLDMGDQDLKDGWTCKAFPNGINYATLKRYIKHNAEDIIPGTQEGTYAFKSKVFVNDGVKEKITFDGDWYKVEDE